MENNGTNQQDSSSGNSIHDPARHARGDRPSPGKALLLLIIYFFAGMFVGQFIGVLLAMGLFGISWDQVLYMASNVETEPNAKYVLYCLQFASALGAFIAGPLFYLHRHEHRSFSDFINQKSRHLIPIVLTVAITFSFMVVNSIFIEWNENVTFPEGMEQVEEFLKQQENQLRELTEYLTTFDSFQDFMLAFVIIAILPAIGEELLFRGLIQKKIAAIFRNPHAGIWLAAILFGIIHFQFYGLVPRIFLGALFGYLYYWSGSLLMPIIAHFINNGFSLLMFYLYQQDMVEFDVAETTALPSSYIIVFLLLGVACCWAYRRYFLKNNLPAYE